MAAGGLNKANVKTKGARRFKEDPSHSLRALRRDKFGISDLCWVSRTIANFQLEGLALFNCCGPEVVVELKDFKSGY